MRSITARVPMLSTRSVVAAVCRDVGELPTPDLWEKIDLFGVDLYLIRFGWSALRSCA